MFNNLMELNLGSNPCDAVAFTLVEWRLVWGSCYTQYIDCLVGGLELFLFFHILGIILPQLTNIFQRGWNHQPVEDHPSLQKSLLINQSSWMTEGSIMGTLTDCQFHYDKSLSTTQKNEMTCRVQTPPEYREVHNERLQNEKKQYLLVLVN